MAGLGGTLQPTPLGVRAMADDSASVAMPIAMATDPADTSPVIGLMSGEMGSRPYIYSIGYIEEASTESLPGGNSRTVYLVKYEEFQFKLVSKLVLRTRVWIRFCGRWDGSTLEADFVEILDGIDVNLMIKYINKLNMRA